MDDEHEIIEHWKIFFWVGIGVLLVIVVWFVCGTCYDIYKTESDEDKLRQSLAKQRYSSVAYTGRRIEV